MADNAVVGILRAMLTADTAQFDTGMRKADATLKGVEQSTKKVGDEVAKLTPQAERMVKAFSGDKLLYSANNIVAAVAKIGGATKLTEAEQARANRTLADAIAKYTTMGQVAPKAMVDLERATRSVTSSTSAMVAGMSAAAKQSQASITMIGGMSQAGRQAAAAMESIEKPTSFLTTKMIALGAAAGSFLGNVAFNAVSKLGQSFLEAAANGAKFTAIEGSFQRLAESIGQSGTAMLMVSRSATKGLISDLDLMQSANKAMLLGLPVTAKEMGTLSKAAITLGRAMGLDATTSLDNLITALGRSSPLILDNLGLTVKVGEANEAYARSLGKTASQLTDAEQKMAFYRAAMDAALRKTEELGEVQLGVVEQMSRLGVSTANLVTTMASGANESRTFAGFLGWIADQAERATKNVDELSEARRNLANSGRDTSFLTSTIGADRGAVQEEMRRIQSARSLLLAQAASPALRVAPGLGIAGPTDAEIKALEEQGKKIEEQAKKLQQRFERLREITDSLFGRDVIARANDFAVALGDVSNVSHLSKEKQQELNQAMTAALAVYARLGLEAPAQIKLIADATATVLQSTTKWTAAIDAMPASIESAAASIEGRWIPALHGVEAALENAAQRQAGLKELLEKGMLPPDLSGVQNEDASGEARQIGRTQLEERLREQRDIIADFWSRQAGALENATTGRLGSLFFGQMGHDITGELRDAALEAQQEFLKIQRNGKATAKELEVAFTRWREAEERANFTFGERWTQFWGGIKQTFVGILDDMLQFFVRNFIGGLVKGISGAGLAQSLGNALTGGVAGAVLGGGTSLASGVLSNGVLTGVGAGGAAGAAPAGGSLAALATNPWTIGIAGAALLGGLIWKKGLFRGGEEATKVSPRRDQFFGQFVGMYGGTPYEAAVTALAKAKVTGDRASALIKGLDDADTQREYDPAQAAFLSALMAGGVKNVKAFNMGGFVPPGVVQPAILHGGMFGEDIVPRKGPGTSGVVLNQHYTVNVNTQAMDGESFDQAFEKQILPRLQWEFRLNQRGTVTVLEKALAN
jgi:hypothetical protein